MSRRIRRILLLGVLLLAVIVLAPGPYSDAGPWHALTDWTSDLRSDWGTRERTLYLSCGWRRLALCNELPASAGPLARIADSMLAAVAKLRCRQWSSNVTAGLLLPGEERPFLMCYSSTEDGSVSMLLDWQGFVASVDRAWTPADPRSEYDAVAHGMEQKYGEGLLCPQSDDLTITDNVRWQLQDFNVGVYLSGNRYLHVDYSFGQIHCHTV